MAGPAARAALAAGAVALAVVLVLGVVVTDEDYADRRSKPAGALPLPPNAYDHSTKEATLSAKRKIEKTANKWARVFAAGGPGLDCRYVTQPACERIACIRVPGIPIKNCAPPSSAFRKSCEDATVQDIAIKGDQAGVKFSNGETVRIDRVGDYVVGGVERGLWWIHKIGGSAGRKFFE